MNSVGWFEIYVDEMPRAIKFYEAVFDQKLENMETPDGSLMAGFSGDMSSYGANGALVKMDGFCAGSNSVLIYFSCDDCSTEEGRIAKAGGRVIKPKFSIGEHGFISLVNDTEGNMIGLHSMA